MTESSARPDRSSSSFPPAAGLRLPARLRGRRPLVMPPAGGARLAAQLT